MSKKISISSIAREVLWALEEAGEEELPVLINTICSVFEKYNSSFLARISNEITTLHQLGLIEMSAGLEIKKSSSLLLELDTLLEKDELSGLYVYKNEDEDIAIILTFRGAEFLIT